MGAGRALGEKLTNITVVTDADIEEALQRVGNGESGTDDENLLRSELRRLQAQIDVYLFGDDGVMELPE